MSAMGIDRDAEVMRKTNKEKRCVPIQLFQKGAPDRQPHLLLFQVAQPPPAGGRGEIGPRKILPSAPIPSTLSPAKETQEK
jgi:hypothetical protein